jgi:hypothetical protein
MDEPERSRGWTLFATIMVGVAGAWNLVLGIAALTKPEYFEETNLLYENLSFWGVVWICVGALQLLTSVLISRRTVAGKALGIAGATASMFAWFFSIGAHPVASIMVIVLDVLIVYALSADRPYGGSAERADRPRRDLERDLSLEPTRRSI